MGMRLIIEKCSKWTFIRFEHKLLTLLNAHHSINKILSKK